MKRLTYDAKGKHFCDYSTREIINRLAECEIMLEKIEQISADYKENVRDKVTNENMEKILEVIKDG